jgi:CheY-like chemotaxis protein
MIKKLGCIMLVDDNPNDNFFHEREIRKVNPEIIVITKNSGIDALEYLKSKKTDEDILPVLIFLDINMPRMNGWEFLDEYKQLNKKIQRKVTIIMLTTSDNPVDIARTKSFTFITDYIIKPLTKEKMEAIFKDILTSNLLKTS